MPTMNGQEEALMELIGAKQWKQALNMCEKKLKKANGSDFLLATKIKILVQWPDKVRQEQGVKELESLVARKPPVTDIEALHALDPIFEAVTKFDSKGRQTWQRAAVSRPQDENLHLVWYWTKFDEGDFKGAQQACMTWMKHFPKDRNPFFRYILNAHLVGEQTTNEQERKLTQTLAYRNLSKAAAEVPETKEDSANAGRHLKTFEDLSLLLTVYQAQGRYAEAISVLKDKQYGMSGQSGRNIWECARQLMDLLELDGQWTELLALCRLILNDARDHRRGPSGSLQYGLGKMGDDWKTWQMLVRANNSANTQENSTSTEELIKSFCSPAASTKERNARLALLLFYSGEVAAGRGKGNELLETIIDYFLHFSTKVACFRDLQPYLSHLDKEQREKLLRDTSRLAHDATAELDDPVPTHIYWITCEINALKLEYQLVISRDHNSHRKDLLQGIISNCLRLFKISLKIRHELPVSDRRPGDDAAILAAMGLIRLFKLGRRNALLQAIVVLEYLVFHSNHNYDALLTLVRLYIFLGAGSLALDRYSRLSIKNVQHATISWVLYTRISSIHPYPATFSSRKNSQTVMTTIDPLDDVAHALNWYSSAEHLSQKYVHSMQDSSQWNKSLECLSTKNAVLNGFAKFLLLVELKRIKRFRSNSHESSRLYLKIPKRTKDTRDRTAFPSFEGGSLTFEEHLPVAGTGTDPNNLWLGQQLSVARFWDEIHNNGGSQLKLEDLQSMRESSKHDPDSMTNPEHSTVNFVIVLHELWDVYRLEADVEKQGAENCIREHFELIGSWIAKSSEDLVTRIQSGHNASMPLTADLDVPLWSFFHALFSILDTCKFVAPTMDYVLTENKKRAYVDHAWLAHQIKLVRDQCTKLSRNVLRAATDLRDKLREGAALQQINVAVLGRVEDSGDEHEIAKQLRELGDNPALEKTCLEIRESWIDGLDGVIRTKVA